MYSSSSGTATGVKGLSESDSPVDEVNTARRLASEEAQRGQNESEETFSAKVQNIMEFVGISGVHCY